MSACFTNLYPIGNDWVGTTVGGKPMHFQSLDTYREYNARMGCPDVSAIRSEEAYLRKEGRTPFAVFKEFKPVRPEQQTLYSAMSPLWVGRTSDAAKVFH